MCLMCGKERWRPSAHHPIESGFEQCDRSTRKTPTPRGSPGAVGVVRLPGATCSALESWGSDATYICRAHARGNLRAFFGCYIYLSLSIYVYIDVCVQRDQEAILCRLSDATHAEQSRANPTALSRSKNHASQQGKPENRPARNQLEPSLCLIRVYLDRDSPQKATQAERETNQK